MLCACPVFASKAMSLVYDVGMFNGDDTAYYLAKGFRVIGIEANPHLMPDLSRRFSREIQENWLVIENVAVAEMEQEVELFIAGDDKPQSSLTRRILDMHNVPVTSTRVRGVTLSSLVQRHGTPSFMKIDVEHADLIVLRDLARHGIKPSYISVEAHHTDVLVQLQKTGYARYRFINGKTVPTRFGNARVRRLDGSSTNFTFTLHSSGPFGDDLEEPWLSFDQAMAVWSNRHALLGPGWYDVHAQ
jgi:FkbM family methyltransferase